jgi:hypothetical protein
MLEDFKDKDFRVFLILHVYLKYNIMYMYFLLDTNKKIIFGWSAKCGCSHIKCIYWYLQTEKLDTIIHTDKDLNKLPDDIENYTTIIITRNPYKRIVSGFLDKYAKGGQFRGLWKDSFLSFSLFVDKLINYDWETINFHHFTPQTTEFFDKKILLSKIIKFYDIEKIDYEYIEQLYNKKIPECVINRKQGHERNLHVKSEDFYNTYVYDLNIDDYIDYKIDIKYFYNEEIREKVLKIYIILKILIFILKILIFSTKTELIT